MSKTRKVRPKAGQEPAGEGKVKIAQPLPGALFKPLRTLKRFVQNPDFGYQFLVVLLTLTGDNFKMDRRIDNMSSSIETLRNITGVINNAMGSLKTAADAHRQVRRLIDPGRK